MYRRAHADRYQIQFIKNRFGFAVHFVLIDKQPLVGYRPSHMLSITERCNTSLTPDVPSKYHFPVLLWRNGIDLFTLE